MRRSRSRHPLGMTLIEIMIVVAILALLLTVLIAYLMPSDDRRCKLEAERLAIFLTASSAEAVMSDGAVRVGCTFDKNVCVRERQRLRAAVTDAMWEIDEKGGTHKVGSPVKISVLELPEGTLEIGTGYFGFRGRRTSGGVAVLALNEAVWSVIVPAQGDVRIERGRAKLPAIPDRDVLGMGPLPDPLAFGPGGGNNGLPSINGNGQSSTGTSGGQPSRNLDNNPSTDEPEIEPDDPEDPDLDAGMPPDQGYDQDAAYDDQDAALELDAEVYECQTNADCTGGWEICEEHECVVDIGNRSFVLRTIQVEAPLAVAPFFTAFMQEAIDDNNLVLGVQIGRTLGNSVGAETPHEAWIVNLARAGGGRYRLNAKLPSFRYKTTQDANCNGGDICMSLEPEESAQLQIFLPRPDATEDCPFTRVAVVANFKLQINSSSGEANLILSGLIQDSAAKDILFNRDTLASMGVEGNFSRIVGLDKVFEAYNIDRDAVFPPNSISSANAWNFRFGGNARLTTIQGDPESLLNRTPEGCE